MKILFLLSLTVAVITTGCVVYPARAVYVEPAPIIVYDGAGHPIPQHLWRFR